MWLVLVLVLSWLWARLAYKHCKTSVYRNCLRIPLHAHCQYHAKLSIASYIYITILHIYNKMLYIILRHAIATYQNSVWNLLKGNFTFSVLKWKQISTARNNSTREEITNSKHAPSTHQINQSITFSQVPSSMVRKYHTSELAIDEHRYNNVCISQPCYIIHATIIIHPAM